ncbi:hypothetical protein SDC9_81633 [bioreactor metagenome]|uniref:Uncharacterized protein n=1 Tax=bioreactor metagenome TaxID=1076179 RepID=A0A644Z8J6_9ZZZZ
MEIIRILPAIFVDKIDDFQVIFGVIVRRVTPFSDHHPGKDLIRRTIQFPFHQNVGWDSGCEVTRKRTVLQVPVSFGHKGSEHHLHQDRLASPVAQRKKRALPIQMKSLVIDSHCVIVVVQVDDSDSIYLTHVLPPPKQ